MRVGSSITTSIVGIGGYFVRATERTLLRVPNKPKKPHTVTRTVY
jgi:hypothetical protein